MDYEERRSFFGKGSYIGCEGSLFIWVFPTKFLHCVSRPFVGVEITRPFQPSKGTTYVKNMILLFVIFIFMPCHKT
jgi:hypothetical protein